MSILYTVRPCDNGQLSLVDPDDEEDSFDYFDYIGLGPRSSRPPNGIITVRVCKKSRQRHNTTQSGHSVTEEAAQCKLKNVTVASLGRVKANNVSEEQIPLDILEETGSNQKKVVSDTQNNSEPQVDGRWKRQAVGSWTDEDLMSEALDMENKNDTNLEENGQMFGESNLTKKELEVFNEILPNTPSPTETMSEGESILKEMDNLDSLNHFQTTPDRQTVDLRAEFRNYTHIENATSISLSVEYDDYSLEVGQ